MARIDEQILALSKITNDSLDVELLTNLTGKKINDLDSKGKLITGSLSLFYEFISHLFKNESERKQVVEPFNIVQNLRSAGSAHRKGSDYNKILKKYGLDQLSSQDRIHQIISKIVGSLDSIRAHIVAFSDIRTVTN